jgi:hypothetical protein
MEQLTNFNKLWCEEIFTSNVRDKDFGSTSKLI